MFYIIANKLHLKGNSVKKLNEVRSVFERSGCACEFLYTDHAGHATEYAREISSRGEENSLIAMGGDGTLHEILNGIEDFEKTALGIIPFGTGNDFAEAAGIPLNVKEAAEIIAFRDPSKIDFIELSSGLRSLNAVGMGIDVDVLKRAYSGKNNKKSKYFRAFLKTLFKFKSCDFTVEYNGERERHYGLIAALGNGRQIGGGIKLFPEAKIDDGYMDMIIVDYLSRPKLISAFVKLMRGKVNSVKEAKVMRVKEAKFINESAEFSIEAEGEIYDNMQIDAKIVTDKLKFYI